MKLDLRRGKAVTTGLLATKLSAGRPARESIRGSARCLISAKQKSLSSIDYSQTHVDILLLGVSIWNQWRASEPLTIPNLTKADLSGLTLENANFSGTDLRGAKLDNAYLYDADFQKADLRGASLRRAVLIGANFYGANLSSAILEHAYLAQSDLSNANFSNACLKESDLRSALLTQAVFTNVSIESADLTACCDLSELQLKASKDGHLAYLSDSCSWPRASLSSPSSSSRPALDSLREEQMAEAAQCADDYSDGIRSDGIRSDDPHSDGPRPDVPSEAPTVAAGARPIDVFQPAREPSLTHSYS